MYRLLLYTAMVSQHLREVGVVVLLSGFIMGDCRSEVPVLWEFARKQEFIFSSDNDCLGCVGCNAHTNYNYDPLSVDDRSKDKSN